MKIIVRYNINGQKEKNYSSYLNTTHDGYSNARVSYAVAHGVCYKNKYWKIYNTPEEVLDVINVPYLCEINGQKFYKTHELIDKFNISRQAVQQAKARKQKSFCGYSVIWGTV